VPDTPRHSTFADRGLDAVLADFSTSSQRRGHGYRAGMLPGRMIQRRPILCQQALDFAAQFGVSMDQRVRALFLRGVIELLDLLPPFGSQMGYE
jgi:hypothetical protein